MDKNEDWFRRLIEDCEAIIIEHSFASRWSLIEGYHTLGQRILEEHSNFERKKIYNMQIAEKVADALGKKSRTIYYAIEFAKKFPSLSGLKEGKDISWYQITQRYLGRKNDLSADKQEKQCPEHDWEQYRVCRICKKKEVINPDWKWIHEKTEY